MLKNLKLGIKLNLLLLSVFLVVVLISGFALSKILDQYAQQVVEDRALLLIETMSSVREYTFKEVGPELAPRLETEDQFLPETVPAYSARSVFDYLRERDHGNYENFFYKEATLNPTNKRDKADKFEQQIVEQFRKQKNLTEQTGFRSFPGGKLFYVARPLVVNNSSCLKCHGIPEDAPKSQILTYGDQDGFGWKLNEIIGAKVLSVPASTVFNEAQRLRFVVIGILGGFFLLAIVLINLFLNFSVIKHLRRMAKLSTQVSTGDMEVEFKHDANDEIGVLATSLNRMKVSLQMAMEMLDPDSKL
ncbi:MAG: DUF3365 domain-containing protein [Symploca sp. SIO3C6]|uniref:DUF3365 domain-containing protein n=1 Tax=Symploca sp. SIO1C4 TaxID=2607765 RepID=A0A6B3NL93_9CYAN|nr:DUF3365 domain-containing protein [Symploca sp. SIO3C6]NER31202.1 DUF3365 domain-containing protein [Symploca sp. SIO1C4]NET03397.1 DUF3365 domain-containing protein [Symploca sp. SIO2B6]